MYYILAISFLIVIFFIFLVLKFSRKRKLNINAKKFLKGNFNIIKKLEGGKEKIIDFDKLYHKILLELKYKGSFGEILKSNPRIINNINSVWELHKLRNKLVHDFDVINQNTLIKKSSQYEKIVSDFLDKL